MIDNINHISIKQISLVGAGPGGVEYLTLKAAKAIGLAEVILYDNLIKDILKVTATPGAELVDVGKRCNDGINQMDRQDYINHLILKYYKAGKRVVRLKGGDPMVFGKIYEEINYLNNANVEFEIIPGLSAGQVGAALFKIPLTVRGKATELFSSTAQQIKNELTDYSKWAKIINKGTPIIIYMGGLQIKEIAYSFLGEGISGDVQIHVLSKVGTQNQSIFSSTLEQVAKIDLPNIELPALLIVGKHAIIDKPTIEALN
ncbi:MAG: uroporphyrinogen-III C-methyltransferase [Salinivirgaceae bacterium]|jgi:uroporphyrin-III C-methyltransferase|nr:uroporphyrinogen-III C-methyltransferase [Salinivirgaceae bacterium]